MKAVKNERKPTCRAVVCQLTLKRNSNTEGLCIDDCCVANPPVKTQREVT